MEQDQAFIISNKRILDATHSTTRMDWHMTIASISGESDVDDKYIAWKVSDCFVHVNQVELVFHNGLFWGVLQRTT